MPGRMPRSLHAGEARYEGALDQFSPTYIRGWVLSRSSPRKSLKVELVRDGEVLGTHLAKAQRHDLVALGHEPHHGIDWDISEYAITSPHGIELRVAGTTWNVPSPPSWPLLIHLERRDKEGVSGWAWNPFKPHDHVQVRVFYSGNSSGHTLADQYRPDLERAGMGAGDHAFTFTFPEPGVDPSSVRVVTVPSEVYPVPKEGMLLAGSKQPTANAEGPEGNAVQSAQLDSVRSTAERLFHKEWYLAQHGSGSEPTPFEHWWEVGRHNSLSPHPLFDADFYLTQLVNPPPQADAFLHVIESEVPLADPHPCFSSTWYINRYPERVYANPLLDYILSGDQASRTPNCFFSYVELSSQFEVNRVGQETALGWYLRVWGDSLKSPHPLLDLAFVERSHSDISVRGTYESFWRAFRKREIRPHLLFDPEYVRAQSGGLRGRRAMEYYVTEGEQKGTKPIPLFWPTWYALKYPRAGSYDTLLAEYVSEGERLYRHPCPGFDPRHYTENNLDLPRARVSPLWHFVAAGQREMRSCHSRFDLKAYATSLPEAWQARGLEHWLSEGMRELRSPHPLVRVNKALASESSLLNLMEPDPAHDAVTVGVTVALQQPPQDTHGLCGAIWGQAYLLDAYHERLASRSPLAARAIKRDEPITRLYDAFDYDAAHALKGAMLRWRDINSGSPLVSVILPTRNRARVIKRAINSVLEQSYQNFELIVVDDGSTDGTNVVIEPYLADPRIRYHAIIASGVAAARNAGIREAKGEIVAYLDSDNYWEPDHLLAAVYTILNEKVPAVYTALRVFNEAGIVKYRGSPYHRGCLARENYIDMNVYVHRADARPSDLWFDERLKRCIDWDFILQMSEPVGPLYVAVVGCNYVDDGGELERITTNEPTGDFFRICLRGIDLKSHVSGRAPRHAPAASVLWPISQSDWAHAVRTLPDALDAVNEGLCELVIVANALDDAATRTLLTLSEMLPGLRVVHLWRSFFRYPALSAAARLAVGERLLFWDSRVQFEKSAIERWLERAPKGSSTLSMPLTVDERDRVTARLGALTEASHVYLPVLTGLPAPQSGESTGLIPVESILLIDREQYAKLGGFSFSFAREFGLADLAIRALQAGSDTILYHSIKFSAVADPSDTPPSREVARELELLRRTHPLPTYENAAPVRQYQFPALKWSNCDWRLIPDWSGGGRARRPLRQEWSFAIHCPAPSGPEHVSWGDYHFCRSIQAALVSQGHSAEVVLRDEWRSDDPRYDAVIHIRGIVEIQPSAAALNILWVISHPDRVSIRELQSVDVVFAASKLCAQHFSQMTGSTAHPLLQAADQLRLNAPARSPRLPDLGEKVLFIGNSRLQPRPIVLDAVQAGLPLSVYGKDWEALIPRRYVHGQYVPNEDVFSWYGAAGVTLNDHWKSMRDYGIISNRIFDAVAAGGRVVTDYVDGVADVFGDIIVNTYHDRADLSRKCTNLYGRRDREAVAEVRASHTIANRVNEMLRVLGLGGRE